MLPDGAVYDMVDFLPDIVKAPLAKRGGWSYLSTSNIGTANHIVAGAYAPFSTPQHLAIDDGGNLYKIISGSPTLIGSAFATKCRLIFYRDKVYITDPSSSSPPKVYNGTSLSNLTGAPAGSLVDSYKDMLILANTSTNKRGVYFSDSGDPTTWDTTHGFVNASMDLSAIWALRDSIIVFGTQRIERIIGSIPPPGGDMELQMLFGVGCDDPRSIVEFEDRVVFASSYGIFVTDGSAVDDVTEIVGARPYWEQIMSGYSPSTWSIAAGRIRNSYVVSVMNGSTFVDCLMIDMQQKRWWRLSNVKATMFWGSVSAAPECFFASRVTRRVGMLSTIFYPSASNKSDADGTHVTPVLETAWRPLGDSNSNLKSVVVDYELEDAASDNPTLSVEYALDPDATSYTSVKDLSGAAKQLGETVEFQRREGFILKDARGVMFRISQSGPSSSTSIRSIAVKGHAREAGRIP